MFERLKRWVLPATQAEVDTAAPNLEAPLRRTRYPGMRYLPHQGPDGARFTHPIHVRLLRKSC